MLRDINVLYFAMYNSKSEEKNVDGFIVTYLVPSNSLYSSIVKNYDAALLTKLLAKETTIHGSKLLYWPFNECYHCKLCTEAVTLY